MVLSHSIRGLYLNTKLILELEGTIRLQRRFSTTRLFSKTGTFSVNIGISRTYLCENKIIIQITINSFIIVYHFQKRAIRILWIGDGARLF